MRSAPSVIFPVGRCAFGGWLALAAWGAGLATLAAWCWQDRVLDGRQAVGAVVLAALGAVAWRQLREPARGLLDWDGGQWLWFCGGDESVVRLEPVVDLQQWLLVRLTPGEVGPAGVGQGARASATWLWLTRGSDPEHWRSLRRAVYFSHEFKALREGLH